MDLTEALEHLRAPATDGTVEFEALLAVGGQLASTMTFAEDSVAIAVGRAALDLQAGTQKVMQPASIHTLEVEPELAWLGLPAPGDRPAVVFLRRITTGATALAVLGQCPRANDRLPVTVVAVEATTEGVAAIQAAHPQVRVVFAIDIDVEART